MGQTNSSRHVSSTAWLMYTSPSFVLGIGKRPQTSGTSLVCGTVRNHRGYNDYGSGYLADGKTCARNARSRRAEMIFLPSPVSQRNRYPEAHHPEPESWNNPESWETS
eukprot:767102-Hanusia_phi.AAC.2